MKTVTMHEAKTHLSRLVDLALAGEDVVIVRRKFPVIRLSAFQDAPTRRKVGSMPRLLKKMSDRFNDSLDDWDSELIPTKRTRRSLSK
jgi:antitoxin (DNA-binding transcriptional repressor) of toxin-antitoxin stability system